MNWETGAAVYAAIVATGALFLEIRRWFESGVRVRARARHVYSMQGLSQHVVVAEVTNIGDAATILTGMEIWGYPSRAHSFLGISLTRGAVIDTKSFATLQDLPYSLPPGDTWSGAVSGHTLETRDRRFAIVYLAVNNTRYDHPFLCKVKA